MKLSIQTYLKSETSELKPIIFKVSFGYKVKNALTGKTTYKPFGYNSGIKVLPKDWDSNLNLPKSRADIAEILRLEDVIRHTYDHLILQKVNLTPALFKQELDIVLGRESNEVLNVVHICDYIEKEIETNLKRSFNTRKQYKTLRNHLVNFEKDIGVRINTDNFKRKLYITFMDRIRKAMNTSNSVWKIEKNLKSVLNDIRRNYKEIEVFNPRDELSKSEKSKLVSEDNVYLNFDKIQRIIEYTPKTDKLKNAKLILLTLLFTGCRYSDVFKVIPEHSFADDNTQFNYAQFITEKGKGTEVVVPILAPLKKAFEENQGRPAQPLSNQKFNDYVKELFKAAKFDEVVSLAYTDANGNKVFKSQQFHSLITSHIGRRSFITNLINHIPVTILCMITGHALKDKSIIFKYNKITSVQNAVLFIEELKRVSETKITQFPIRLI